MSIPVIFSTGSLYTFGLERVFGWVSGVGFDGVEVMMDDRWDTHQEDYLRYLTEKHGVEILALHPPIYQGAWHLSRDETLVRAARLASNLGVPTVVAHPPRPGGPLQSWREGPLLEAREVGVTVAVENMPKVERKTLPGRLFGGPGSAYSPEHLRGFEEVTLDTSHAASWDLGILDFYRKVAPRLRHVHLSDSDGTGGDQHRLPGRGKLPLTELLASLATDGFSGAVSLELKPFQSGAPHPERIVERMDEALDYARRGLGGE